MAYRAAVHSTTGHSPQMALFGRPARLPADSLFEVPRDELTYEEWRAHHEKIWKEARENHSKAAESRAKQYDKAKNVVDRAVAVGERVYWKRQQKGKLEPLWAGPFIVTQVESRTNVRIKGATQIEKTVHLNQIKKCHDDSPLGVLRGRGRPPLDRSGKPVSHE